ncbi:MAG: F0F1 ATP synthase subunit delta, partial [Candidatus Nanopelagicales bacterium]|nr:F0F1 ATP synthase subunit delta [Candidatus Nanopelagicales bacterium]
AVLTGKVVLSKGDMTVRCPKFDLKFDTTPHVRWAKGSGGVVADVRVAAPLDDAQRNRLQSLLSQIKGREVRLNVAVDPSVLGGVFVQIGDEVIDGTVVTRMEQARRALLG